MGRQFAITSHLLQAAFAMKAVFVNHLDLMYLSNEAIRQLWDVHTNDEGKRSSEKEICCSMLDVRLNWRLSLSRLPPRIWITMNQFLERDQTCHACTANRWTSLPIRFALLPYFKRRRSKANLLRKWDAFTWKRYWTLTRYIEWDARTGHRRAVLSGRWRLSHIAQIDTFEYTTDNRPMDIRWVRLLNWRSVPTGDTHTYAYMYVSVNGGTRISSAFVPFYPSMIIHEKPAIILWINEHTSMMKETTIASNDCWHHLRTDPISCGRRTSDFCSMARKRGMKML